MVETLDYLTAKAQIVNDHLDKLIPSKSDACEVLFEAARYSLLGPGKRLRPILTLATVEVLGGNLEWALDPACSLELIHTYSMIHDDLPCMDDDNFRRGRPTLHRVFPEGQAVLAGDYLLTYAFEVLANAPGLTPDQRLQLVHLLAKAAGGQGMIGGQVLDLQAEKRSVNLEELRRIHLHKTASLITAALDMGAVVAEASPPRRKNLHQFGVEIGLAFQIVDDILDVTESEQKHGNAQSSDVARGKSTYVSLLGLEKARESAALHFEKAIHHLEQLDTDPSILYNLAYAMTYRNR